MSAAALITRCRILDVRLSVKSGRLRYSAPRGTFNPDLLAELVAHKAELVALLATPPPAPFEPAPAAEPALFDLLTDCHRTPWGTLAWSDPEALPIELFGEIPDPSVGAAISSLSTKLVRWRCLSPFCRDGSRWWLSAHGVVQCVNCRAPAFPELIVAHGTLADAPLVDPDRSTTAVLVNGGDHAA
jgi:hypothetical protein